MGTPPLDSGEADLSAIDNVARQIAAASRSPKLVIEKSTVPAQTGEQLRHALHVYGRSKAATFRVASNPEFLREGTAVADFFHPDRIVVGVEDAESEAQLREIMDAAALVLSRGLIAASAPVVGAGVGRGVIHALAARMGRSFIAFDDLIDAIPEARSKACDCAPASAVALLAAPHFPA